ncbi:MAG: (2Fe-2S)-binding protein [Anaerolineae bacterium]|nr:(2Fe-2S)-binding protein [Anaerolineae bacterium]
MNPKLISLTINGSTHQVALSPNTTLLHALRDLGHTDVKSGCEKGDCGACGVLIDGVVVNSCLLLAWLAENKELVTVAGLGTPDKPHPLHKAFVDLGAAQCGYCIPGMILSAKALLDQHPQPTDEQIRESLSGNLCRCTGYVRIFEAVRVAAQELGSTLPE